MRLIRVKDEKDRDIGWYATLGNGVELISNGVELISHTYSYGYSRQLREDMGDVMGFNNPLEKITRREGLDMSDL